MRDFLLEIDVLALVAIVLGLLGSLVAVSVLYKHTRLKKLVDVTAIALDQRIAATEESVKKLLYDDE